MAFNIKTLSRFTVPGGGYTTAGVAKNNKTVVIGQMSITSYTTGGEVVSPASVGLDAIDFLTALDIRTVNNAATEPAATAIPLSAYIQSTNKLLIIIDHDTNTEVNSGEAASLRFLAVGDSGTVADLT